MVWAAEGLDVLELGPEPVPMVDDMVGVEFDSGVAAGVLAGWVEGALLPAEILPELGAEEPGVGFLGSWDSLVIIPGTVALIALGAGRREQSRVGGVTWGRRIGGADKAHLANISQYFSWVKFA